MKTHSVVLDPGHGGSDPGAVGLSGTHESDMVLDICLRARALLSPYVNVLLTRTTDYYISLTGRAAKSNSEQADVFCSVHLNAAGSESPSGFEIFTYYGTSSADRLAELIEKNHTGLFPNQKNRGLKEASFTVLRKTSAPAVLYEGCFLTNRVEEAMVMLESTRQKMAQAISSGILEFLGLETEAPVPALTLEQRVARLEAHLGL